MTEYPEEMDPDQRGTAGLCVEEMATQIAIDKQHELRCCERSDRHECQHAHYEKQPCEQRHSHERHPFATHRDDRRNNVDRSTKGAKTTDDERKGPIIGRMTRRKRPRSEWR